MQPLLAPLDAVDRLPGVGASAREGLEKHGIRTIADLIWTPPSGWDDLRSPRSVEEVIAESRASNEPIRAAFEAIVVSGSIIPMRGRRGVRVVVRDVVNETCKLHAFWFFLAHGVLAIAKPNAKVLLIGRVTVEPKKPPRTAHPDLFADSPSARTVRPRYPRLGPSGAIVKKAIAHALSTLPSSDDVDIDPVPSAIAKREAMRDATSVLRDVHAANGALPSDDDKRAFVERLAWAEALTRARERVLAEEGLGAAPSTPLPAAPRATKSLEKALGFVLTADQRAACDDVSTDLAKTRPMRRLLLGDVGTGKTVVALMAIAQCIAAGRQAAILAPTSVLAEQYLVAVRPLVESSAPHALATSVAFVAAGMPVADRRASEAAIASGEANIIIGTHALLSEAIAIPKLSLVVVDEQQRLGVGQRHALVKKGKEAKKGERDRNERPHLLTLSATPIPRTLALALRGELATSTLRELPAGRHHATTELASRSDVGSIILRVAAARDRNERVFWIVPRVEADPDGDDDKSDDDDLASAEARAASLREYLGRATVGIIHGKMSAADKRSAMNAFRSGASPVLVGTTVVEVGVDVPEATLIVVEDASVFGLAQLHQLRGRVGRGERAGECILIHRDGLDGLAKERLLAMTRLSSGEEIARADLELRGEGDLGGSRQHGGGGGVREGDNELVFLDANVAYPWLERIESDARALHASDPNLESPEHRVLGSIVQKLERAIALREEAG